MTESFDVGARLRAVREMHGLSQRELAKRAGVSNAIISLIEQNRNSPSMGSMKRVLEGLPMSLADFFAGETASRPQVFLTPPSSSNWRGGKSPTDKSAATFPNCSCKSCTNATRRAPIPAKRCCAMSRRKVASYCAGVWRSRSAISVVCSVPAMPTISTAACRTASAIPATRNAKSSPPALRRVFRASANDYDPLHHCRRQRSRAVGSLL